MKGARQAEDFARNPHTPALDGLRGMAAYMVVISHVSNATGLWGTMLGQGGGQVGVMIFFVLSGYLMGALYRDRPMTAANVMDYAVRRFARVVPLFYLVVTASFVLEFVSVTAGLGFQVYGIRPDEAVIHYAFVWGVNVLWTIPVEIHFYVLFVPLWWLYARSARAMILLSAFAAIAYCVLPITVPQEPRTFPYYAVFFLCGMLTSHVVRLDAQPAKSVLWTVFLTACFLLPFILYPNIYAVLFGRSGWLLREEYQQMWHDARYPAAATLCLVAALCAAPVRAMLAHKVMVYAGAISYSVYLLHIPVIGALARFTPLQAYPVAFLLAALAGTTVLATVSFFAFERPVRLCIYSAVAAARARAGTGRR